MPIRKHRKIETIDLPLAAAWENLRYHYFSKRPHYEDEAKQALMLCRHYQQRLADETA